ncbi:MAG: hypothetical protein IM569_13790 [Chitinophagaceae bacterium]|jgi:hypothetical protein|nr:hypothetical protein [Chitinophagaceae bacterium]MCA6513922.1 hypothetical protein [Chitinophagaceae bacterium]
MKQLTLFIALVCFFSCSPVKKAARKDAKAVDRVLGSRALIDQIKPAVLELYPCANDTVGVWFSGGVDSIPYPVPQIDTVYNPGNAYDQGFFDGQLSVSRKKFAVKRPDTIRVTVVDRQKQKADAETISQLRMSISKLEGQLTEKDKRISKSDKWLWYFIAAVVAFFVSNVTWLYFKIRTK